jgi:O-antigen ligase
MWLKVMTHEYPMGTHNGPLDLGVQAGLHIVFLYLAIVIFSICRMFKSRIGLNEKRVLISAITMFIIAFMFQTYSIGGASYGSLVLTILLGMANFAPILYGYKKKIVKKNC